MYFLSSFLFTESLKFNLDGNLNLMSGNNKSSLLVLRIPYLVFLFTCCLWWRQFQMFYNYSWASTQQVNLLSLDFCAASAIVVVACFSLMVHGPIVPLIWKLSQTCTYLHARWCTEGCILYSQKENGWKYEKAPIIPMHPTRKQTTFLIITVQMGKKRLKYILDV